MVAEATTVGYSYVADFMTVQWQSAAACTEGICVAPKPCQHALVTVLPWNWLLQHQHCSGCLPS